ncbi:MAG: hypothetical protein HQ541_19335 [Mariniphaga sp.]|nr:hypothetical protein [Mariniphaga sp.]
MIKKINFLAMVVLLFAVFNGCQKDEILEVSEKEVSEYYNEYGKYQKNIIVYDESGNNSLFLLIHSDFPNAVENFLASTELILELNNEIDFDNLKSKSIDEEPINESDNLKLPNQVLNRKVNIELITENIQANTSSYYLHVKAKEVILKSASDFQWGPYASYKTTGDFIGVVHQGFFGTGYDIYVYLEKTNSWLAGWDILWQGLREGDLSSNYYWVCLNYTATGNPYYKIGAGVYLDSRASVANYYIAYSKDAFRGRSCTIGSYDTRNCYVGIAPSGTTAFMHPNAQGAFYYTPINGNECPLPGSSFDTANCYVVDIPSSCEGFIHNNKWYVKPDKIYSY